MEPFAIYRAWWADAPRRHSPKTARDYRGFVLRWMADTGHDPRTVTARQIKDYTDRFRTNHANGIRQGLSALFIWMVEHGLREANPIAGTRSRSGGARRYKKIKRALTIEELTRLLVAMHWVGHHRRRWTTRREALLMLAQFYTGLRPGELISLTVQRIHLEGPRCYVEITETKTGADRMVPISTRAAEVFGELCHDRVGRISDIGLKHYYGRVKQACWHAEIPPEKARPYALRHAFATYLVEYGVPERHVAELMGHSDLRAIWGYTVPDDAILRAAVELLP